MHLIDADHFIATLDTVVQKHESVLWQKIAETMKYMIEVEVEIFPVAEIVRCKDCKYGAQDEDGLWYCTDLHGNTMGEIDKEDTDFCSRAERRQE